MPHAGIVPDRGSTLSPMHPGDAIMIHRNQPHDVISNHLVFIVIYPIDTCHVETDSGEDRFPAGLPICADDGVDGRERVANIER
jgi:hypothetical protein